MHDQAERLDALERAAADGRSQAERGLLFCSREGLALVNAAFDLFECDALYDLAGDVSNESGIGRDGFRLGNDGERKFLRG